MREKSLMSSLLKVGDMNFLTSIHIVVEALREGTPKESRRYEIQPTNRTFPVESRRGKIPVDAGNMKFSKTFLWCL